VRTVPPPATRLDCLAHPRLRRASAISKFVVAAATEALQSIDSHKPGYVRLGIVVGTHAACLRYSERFFGEVLDNPLTASPVLFPETVINIPASHLATILGGAERTYSLLGDQTAFVQALVVATEWLLDGRVDVCLVIGAEEIAWTAVDALGRFWRDLVPSEGAGALALAHESGATPCPILERVTEPHLYAGQRTRVAAARVMRAELPSQVPRELLVDARCGVRRADTAETEAWRDWSGPRLSPRVALGEGLAAATAWQCVAACAALIDGQVDAANVSVVGANQQAISARFERAPETVSLFGRGAS
jgi:3-oxoacyl-(acyl-carrier-protein) synthase